MRRQIGTWKIAVLKAGLLGLLCALPALILAQARVGSARSQPVVRTFPVGSTPSVVLVNTSLRGNVAIQAWTRQEIQLAITTTSATARVDIHFSNDVLTVKVQKRRATGPDAVDLEVKVPPDCAIEASTIGGKIRVHGVRGHMKLSTMEGDIELADVSSPSIDAMSVTTGRIMFSGSLHERGTYSFYSGTGTIEIALPGQSSFTLDASTHEGRIETEGIRLQTRSRTSSHLQGIAETGSALLKLRTHSGRIRVRHR
ncbi:MAG: DUF4097 domain-containing protein [Blastocatellia bacterium]|nr:DUF4097 domain-containing protein [Blastocatellia bacterium]MCS7157085.1 DUF4097 domain-containing protein [Blastocatellia bacterium]MCX7752286.1 DUF4097 domain-containing protein [Blastocatellia bacterium]MDW8167778.1 DUF4097 family beta strand repeat-containing protein [Acidobacteriota bacterium]MDW8256599.1 DUF4097 family beta strand repeat-containing protein [Acidobacteriota bacterium]